MKAKPYNLKNRQMLTKQQKHVSIIPTSSGEVRSFILMVPSLENKQKKTNQNPKYYGSIQAKYNLFVPKPKRKIKFV